MKMTTKIEPKELMKSIKNNLFLITAIFSSYCFSQSTDFGLSAGYLNIFSRTSDNTESFSTSDSGFYLGAFSKINLNKKFSIRPELNYGRVNRNGFGFISLQGSYYILDKLSIQAGPQVSYLFDVNFDEINKAGFDISTGLVYDISDKFHVQARYAFEITNRINDPNLPSDIRGRFNWLFVGLGYSF